MEAVLPAAHPRDTPKLPGSARVPKTPRTRTWMSKNTRSTRLKRPGPSEAVHDGAPPVQTQGAVAVEPVDPLGPAASGAKLPVPAQRGDETPSLEAGSPARRQGELPVRGTQHEGYR